MNKNSKIKRTIKSSFVNVYDNFYKINKIIEKKLIKVNIISNKNLILSDQNIKSEVSKENESTEIEIYNTETIENLIRKYCKKKEIKSNNYLYLAKQDLKKIDKNLTLKEAKIENNETLFILEDQNNNNFNNEKDSLNKEIIFYINYEGVSHSFSGFKENTFIDCIKSFTEDNGEKNFIINNKIIDINKTLNELCINNGDVIKVGEIEK